MDYVTVLFSKSVIVDTVAIAAMLEAELDLVKEVFSSKHKLNIIVSRKVVTVGSAVSKAVGKNMQKQMVLSLTGL